MSTTDTTQEISRKTYEVSFLVPTEEAAYAVADIAKNHKGVVMQEGQLKKIALAYPIAKKNSAVFGFFHVALDPNSAKIMESELKSHSEVMRSLIISLKEPKKAKVKEQAKEAVKTTPGSPLSNEAIEKKIEEILS